MIVDPLELGRRPSRDLPEVMDAELVQLEYNEIRQAVDFERTEGAKKWSDLFRPGIFRRVFLGTSLQMWSQLTGMK